MRATKIKRNNLVKTCKLIHMESQMKEKDLLKVKTKITTNFSTNKKLSNIFTQNKDI